MPKAKKVKAGRKAPALSPEQAGEVLAMDLANMKAKVDKGQTLTVAERAILDGISKKSGAAPSSGPGPAFAKNQTRLADLLNVSRKTIQRYAKRPDSPRERANGNLPVEEWRTYLAKHEALGGDDIDVLQEKAKLISLQNIRLANRIAIEKNEWIPRAVARQVFSQLVLEAKTRSFNSATRYVMLAKAAASTAEGVEEIRREMEQVWKSLEDSEWFKPGGTNPPPTTT